MILDADWMLCGEYLNATARLGDIDALDGTRAARPAAAAATAERAAPRLHRRRWAAPRR